MNMQQGNFQWRNVNFFIVGFFKTVGEIYGRFFTDQDVIIKASMQLRNRG